MKLDVQKFIWLYEQQYFKTLKENYQEGLKELLDLFATDEHMDDPRWIAYCLATVFHECAGTWLPIAEYGKGRGRKYGEPAANGKVFYGRGYVQLTWADNYKAMSKVTGVDLYNNPDAAMLTPVAYRIMSYGMRNGSFTGVGLKRYINEEKCDYVNARRIINGTDKADLIAGYAHKFELILDETA